MGVRNEYTGSAYRTVDTERASEYAKELMGIPEARPAPRPSRIATLVRSAWESWIRGTLFIVFLFFVALPVTLLACAEVYRLWSWVFTSLGVT